MGILGWQPIKKVSSPEIEFLEPILDSGREKRVNDAAGLDGPPVGHWTWVHTFPHRKSQCHCHCHCQCLLSFQCYNVHSFILYFRDWCMITRQLLTATITLKWNKWTNISLLRRYHVGKEIIYTWVYTLVFLVSKSGLGRYEVTISVYYSDRFGVGFKMWLWIWDHPSIFCYSGGEENFVDFQFHPAQFVKKVGQGMCLLRSKKSLWISNSIFNLRTVSGQVKHSFSIAYFQFHPKHFAKEWFNVTFHPTGDQFLTV